MFNFELIVTLAVVIIAFLGILSLPLSGLQIFLIEVILLGIYSYYLHKKYNIEYYYGMLMLKTQQGLSKIDNLANFKPGLWKTISDIGIVMSFGIFSAFLYKHISRKNFVIGGVILFLFMYLIFPMVYPIAMSVITIPFISSSTQPVESAGINLVSLLLSFGSIAIGISFIVVLSLVTQSFIILNSIYNNLFNGAVETITPGVSLILPGINIPFVEGILALAVLLFVHELSHALLARVANIKLNSAGVLLFGFIPLGAFVDPDDEELNNSKKEEQGRVIVAGSTSNFILASFALLLFLSLSLIPFNVYDTGVMILNAKDGLMLEKGDVIYSINGIEIESLEHFMSLRSQAPPNETLILDTSKGELSLETDENSQIGIYLSARIKSSFGWYTFLRNFFALLFSLNFFVGMINLLPLPLFDGHHLLGIGLGENNRKVLTVINIIVVGAMLINILPIFF